MPVPRAFRTPRPRRHSRTRPMRYAQSQAPRARSPGWRDRFRAHPACPRDPMHRSSPGAGFVSRAPEGQPVRHPSPDCRPIRDSRDYQETRWARRCWLDIRILSDGERPRIVMAGGTAERSLVTPEGLGERLCFPATGRLTSGSRLSPRTKSVGKAQDCGRIRGLYKSCPPSTEIVCPVTQLASGEARKTTTLATSSGWPRRPNGMLRRMAS